MRKSTVLRGKGTYPVWNEKFKLKAEFPSENDDYKIVLKVYDEDRLTEDDFIGTTSIYVEDLLALGVEKGSYELHRAIYRVVLEDGTYCGELQVGLKFTKVEGDINEEDLGGWKESQE
ncbi:elicitor-responsive protein 1-like [Carica papaya]|uniref:elicitor-responsive protein 1-like n=1 Tax=Carica papaya TaxID=3649 RepID=UPI000B8C8490|nr:elicitor-responsive protein 1-like [Carica papaya]